MSGPTRTRRERRVLETGRVLESAEIRDASQDPDQRWLNRLVRSGTFENTINCKSRPVSAVSWSRASLCSRPFRATGSRSVMLLRLHPGCTRRVAAISGTKFASIYGADEDGKPWARRRRFSFARFVRCAFFLPRATVHSRRPVFECGMTMHSTTHTRTRTTGEDSRRHTTRKRRSSARISRASRRAAIDEKTEKANPPKPLSLYLSLSRRL